MKRTLILGSLSGGNILLAFIYQWYIVTRIGPGIETDALIAGMGVPQLVLVFVCGSLVNVLIPLLSNKEGDQFHRDAWIFIQLIGLLFLGINGFLFITATIWVPWTVPGFDNASTFLTIHLLRIQLLGVFFEAINSVLISVNSARQRFVLVEACIVFANIMSVFFFIWAYPQVGVDAAVWGMVLRSAFITLFLYRDMGPYHKIAWRSDSVNEVWQRLKPLILGTSFYRTGHLVDRFFASMSPRGLLTLFHLSQQIYNAGSAVLNKTLVSTAMPELSQKAYQSRWSEFGQILNKRLVILAGASIFGFLGILFLGKPMLALLFSYKSFGAQEVEKLWWFLIALAGLWLGGTVGNILSAGFYAQGNTVTPTKIGTIGYFIGLILKGTGFYLGGLIGLAIGTSMFYLLNCVLLYVFLAKSLKQRAVVI